MSKIRSAIEYLEDSKCDQRQGDDYQEIHNELLDIAIEALKKQLNGGWISVKDRLPEESKAYLVQYNYGYENSKDWCEVIHFQHNCKKWKRLNHLAIAWQPLPEKYVEVKKEIQ